jgi:hypothetical protein
VSVPVSVGSYTKPKGSSSPCIGHQYLCDLAALDYIHHAVAPWWLVLADRALEKCIKVSRTSHLPDLNHLNMSGCAVASDGSLLSPSKIDFYNDANDIAPISGPSLAALTALSASMDTSSATTLDNYFMSHQPAIKLAGVHCTTCPSKPSAWV